MATGAQAAVLPVCDVCCSKEEVRWFCKDCQEKLCIKCKTAHQGSRKTRNDEIVPITEVKHQDSPKIVPILCLEHKTKVCELYCQKCEQLICSQCLDQKHKSHQFFSVEKLIESKASELDGFEKCLHSKLSSCDSIIREESQQHSDFITHVDKLIVEVKDETDKIIQAFTRTKDKTIFDLSQLKKKAEQIYKRKINSNQTKASEIRKSVDDIEKARISGNAQIIILTVNELKQKIPSIEVPTVSKLPLPNLQHNACHPTSILQLNIPDIEVVTSQIPAGIPVSQTGVVATQATIDMNNVKVKVDTCVPGKEEEIRVICPTDNNRAWIVMRKDYHLTLVDTNGCIVKTTGVVGHIWDAVSYYTDILCTTRADHYVMRVSKDGDSITFFADLSPFYTRGLCVTSDEDILVCVKLTYSKCDRNCKVVRLNDRGEIIQEIQHNNQEPMFSSPSRITSPSTGDVVVVDWVSDDICRLVCTDRSGKHRYTWTGKVGGRQLQEFTLSRVTHSNNSVYITDVNSHCVYVLDSNGKADQFMLKKKHGIKKPVAIAIDNRGQLWLGCQESKLYILE